MYSLLFWFLLLSGVLWGYLWVESRKSDRTKQRQRQYRNLFRENVLKRKLESYTEQKVKYAKRHQVETVYLQAGFRITYAEHLLLSAGAGLCFALIAVFLLNNPLLMAIFFYLGFLFPKQIVGWVKNVRIERMERQVGPFMQMVLKRYETTRDFAKALEMTTEEFRGEEPLYQELRRTVLDLRLGRPVDEALDRLALRTGNKFLKRFADYYQVAADVGTEEIRKGLLQQAYLQYKENQEAKRFMKRELAGVKREAYILTGSIPVFVLWQVFSSPTYIEFMTETLIGKIGTAFIFAVFVGSLWFVVNKISAPLD